MLLPFQERKEEPGRNRTSASQVSHQRIPPRSPRCKSLRAITRQIVLSLVIGLTSSSSLRGFESLPSLLLPPTWWWKHQAEAGWYTKANARNLQGHTHLNIPRYLRRKEDQGSSYLQLGAKREPRVVMEIYTHGTRRLLNSYAVHTRAKAWIFKTIHPHPNQPVRCSVLEWVLVSFTSRSFHI